MNAANGLNDILVEVDLSGQPFAHPKKDDIIWKAGLVSFDYSETQEAGFSFPVAEYQPVLPDIKLWKGVYIEELSITLPEQFGGEVPNQRDLSAGLKNVVIDHNGFTGLLELSGLLSIEEGSMDGWPFSIDLFRLHFYRNNLAALSFEGQVEIPLFSSESISSSAGRGEGLDYLADFDIKDGRYLFKVNTTEDITRYAKMLKAEFTLKSNSSLEVVFSTADGFDVTATLHGSLKADADYGELSLQIPEISFENVQVTNRAPYVANGGVWNLEGDLGVDMGGFDLVVQKPTLVPGQEEGEVELKFFGKLNLAFGNGIDVSSGGAFRIVGKVETEDEDRQNWRYEKLKVDMIYVNASKPNAFSFNGYVLFFEDLGDYGSGFQGLIELSVDKLKVNAAASAIFGNAGEFRYYFVDIMARLGKPLPIAGPLGLAGFGGGVYNNMAPAATVENFSDVPASPEFAVDPENPDAYREYILDNWIGKSVTGVEYGVAEGIFGINAGVVLATEKEEVFNANLTFNVEFNKPDANGAGGGIRHVKLSGYANTMAPISWTGPSCEGISIAMKMEYSFEENEFRAEAHAFINVPGLEGNATAVGGSSMVSSFYDGSTCSGSYAGGMHILFSEEDWYLWIGGPSPDMFEKGANASSGGSAGYPGPISLTLLETINVSSYFDIGTNIPPFPGLPSRVRNLTGLGNLLQNESQRASEGGFMFGSAFDVENKINAFGIFKAELALGVGFDVQVRKFGGITCEGSGDLGINGWYGAGQAWAYVEGNINVAKFTIFDLGLGAAIQLKGPNPTYGRGVVGGKYKILGGLINGKCRFPIEFGKSCQVEGGGELEIDYQVINTLSPDDKEEAVNIDTKPSVEFWGDVDEVIQLPDPDNGTLVNHVIKLDYAKLTLDGSEVSTTREWINGRSILDLLPGEFLLAETEYVVEAKALLYKADENGDPTGNPIHEELRTHQFTTGPGLNYIPHANVKYAYPADGQFNYYAGESSENYLQLERGQDELLESVTLEIKIDNDEESYTTTAAYDGAANRINFSLPGLSSGGAYRLQLIPQGEMDKPLYTMFFRVSRSGTFAAKIQAAYFDPISVENVINGGGGDEYVSHINGLLEPFGVEETTGLGQFAASLELGTDLDNTDWIKNYTQLELEGVGTVDLYAAAQACDGYSRDYSIKIDGLDVPRSSFGDVYPDQAIFLLQKGGEKCIVTAGNYQDLHNNRTSANPVEGVEQAKVLYILPYIVNRDLIQLQAIGFNEEVLSKIGNGGEEELKIKAQAECSDLCYGGDGTTPDYCEISKCCEQDAEFRNQHYNYYLNIYNSYDPVSCFRLMHVMADKELCKFNPIVKRELFEGLDLTGNYPITFRYQALNGESSGTQTINLSFSAQ